MSHLVAAPDKFRGTASATSVAAAAARAARARGLTADEVPLADGGEGSVEIVERAIGGTRRTSIVAGPLGQHVAAQWLLVEDTSRAVLPSPLIAGDDPTGVIGACEAAGRHLLPAPRGDEVIRASTRGVGELVRAAVGAGARQLLICVGGTATTDGGTGAVDELERGATLDGARLVVACDVTTRFATAARVFAPQKGASPARVALLDERLARVAERYRTHLHVDVDALEGAGAGGGLAGGLGALGATLVRGSAALGVIAGLDARLGTADLVMTGEGRLDETSFSGKVVGHVTDVLARRAPLLCVAGSVDPRLRRTVDLAGLGMVAVSLADSVGARRARHQTKFVIEEAVAAWLASMS